MTPTIKKTWYGAVVKAAGVGLLATGLLISPTAAFANSTADAGTTQATEDIAATPEVTAPTPEAPPEFTAAEQQALARDLGAATHDPKRPLPTKADFSSPAALAISLSYPLYKNGTAQHPGSKIPGGPIDQELASDLYKQVRKDAWAKSVKYGSRAPAWYAEGYANCSAFTGMATIIAEGGDPTFPGFHTNRQLDYVSDPANGWVRVADGSNYKEKQLEPGDLFITENEPAGVMGHTWMWIGEHEGVPNVVSQASYASAASGAKALLPELQIDPLRTSTTGKDKSGRSYGVWRWTGGERTVGSKVGLTDFNTDGIPDVFATHKTSNELLHYRGVGDGRVYGAVKKGTLLKDQTVVTPGDFNGDGIADLIGQADTGGQLWLYPGTKNGSYGAKVQIGKGFQTIRSLAAIDDFDGDGGVDLIGVHKKTGDLLMWSGTGNGKLKASKKIGYGWGNMEVSSGADLNGDGNPDILAKNMNSGSVFLYPGNGKGTFRTARVQIATGWKNRTVMSPGDLDRDGFGDIVSRNNTTGQLDLYPGGRGGKLGTPKKIGTGWNTLRQIA